MVKLFIQYTLIRCSESMNEKISILVGWLSANNDKTAIYWSFTQNQALCRIYHEFSFNIHNNPLQ